LRAQFEQCPLSAFGFDARGLSALTSLFVLKETSSAAAYIREFKSLDSRITSLAPLSETERIFRYRAGLKKWLANKVLVKPDGTQWATLSEIAEFAVRQDEMFSADRQVGSSAQEQLTTRGGSSRAEPSGSQNGTPSSWAMVARRGHQASASRGAQQKLAAKGRLLKMSAAPPAMDAKLGIR